jgi:ATP-binding cassette subfamily C protein CydD
MSTLRALGAIGHQRRLVERAATELAHRTAAVLRIAFLASSALEWVSTFAIGMVAMYVGATLLGYVRAPLLPSHLSAQAGVFVLLLAPAYFAPLRRFAAAYHQRQEALAAAEILAPLSRRATADAESGPTVATGPGTDGRTPASASCFTPDVELQGVTVRFAGSRVALGDVSVCAAAGVRVTGPRLGKSSLLKVAGAGCGPAKAGRSSAGHRLPGFLARGLLSGQHLPVLRHLPTTLPSAARRLPVRIWEATSGSSPACSPRP